MLPSFYQSNLKSENADVWIKKESLKEAISYSLYRKKEVLFFVKYDMPKIDENDFQDQYDRNYATLNMHIEIWDWH